MNDIGVSVYKNKPEKPPMSPKTKKKLMFVLCIAIGIAIAAGVIFVLGLVFQGASTPEDAIAEYEKAAILYDIDGMIEYSSPYNKVELYGKNDTNDDLLKDYLEKGYEGYTPQYEESELKFEWNSVNRYSKGDVQFEQAMKKYDERVQNGSEDIDEIAIVRMTITKGKNKTTRNYVAVKIGLRWYFGYGMIS